ncbi:transcriptional regulator [Paenibacillus sp. ACRRX]|uniref:ArpU family phage packaging/lysis transcriptional regulator n=1 Tax=Paenibacillus sp. ACRRX TaxID=2918206 RepID=UPI001EF432FC|nr:ArpU family phage packaging/lysis transcriptional regulator [Paenibacillus sp. ACRRX]MCG7406766.1 transcriptional regulator [Paenibacillus sp. ACRRX]
MGQLSIFKLDEKETWRRVEERLESARLYKRFGFIRREIKNTPSYEPKEFGNTNAISKPCEDVAIWNVDREEQLQRDYSQVMSAVGKLSRIQKHIIDERYLNDEDVTDINVYVEMHMSERSYYYAKSKAMNRLAFALRLEVFSEDTA